MISHKYQCIFIHIPKCAGTSIERSLGFHKEGIVRGAQDHRRVINLERLIWPPARGVYSPLEFTHYFKQRTIAKKRGFATLTKSEWERYYKFSIVRNPWDRVFSWYRNVIRDPLHRQSFGVSETCSFSEFAERHLDCWALDPQLDWLRDSNGQLATDHIGLFENLPETYSHIRTVLGIDEPELPNLLKSARVDYREHYSDPLRKRVAEKYAQEIDIFNYAFE